jgi:hypothetical protein
MILNVSPTETLKQTSGNAYVPTAWTARDERRTPAACHGRGLRAIRSLGSMFACQRQKLLYENVPAGRSIAIEGVAPFSVFLGNAEGVRVEFNGQNFDIGRYKRGQVARFTLGDEKAENN